MYEEIKKNLIEHFFNTHYRWTCCTTKGSLFSDMQTRCPFRFKIESNGEAIEMNLGNNVVISFNFIWEEKPFVNNCGKNMTSYRLIKIV